MIETILEWFDENARWAVPTALVLALLAYVALAVFEANEWEKFKAQHHCVKVAETQAQTLVNSDGKVVTVPGTTSYKCDDGIVYTR